MAKSNQTSLFPILDGSTKVSMTAEQLATYKAAQALWSVMRMANSRLEPWFTLSKNEKRHICACVATIRKEVK